MFQSKRTRLALSLVSAATFSTMGSLALGGTAFAHGDHGGPAMPNTMPAANTKADASGDATFFVASLNGKNEVPGPAGSPAVGDKDGEAIQVLRIKGNQVSFAIKYSGIAAPTAGHIHAGGTGVNGAVKIPFFATPLPGSVNAVVGTVTVDDKALLESIKKDPTQFYANLHTAEFAGGAVRAQLHKTTKPVDLNTFLRGGPLTGLLDGGQEVDAPGKKVGDLDGRATGFAAANKDSVKFAFSWSGVAAPTNGHLHQGGIGTNGPVVVDLFAATGGLPASITGVAGSVSGVKADLTKQINEDPAGFYLNLHTTEFDGGAVRSQLFRSGGGASAFDAAPFVASVTKGEQIYKCTKGEDGKFTFTQNNVAATLETDIKHSFVKDGPAGPPQWISKDGSAVQGKLISKSANGDKNIAELDLDAIQSGAKKGQFANVVELHRLNTVGGVAPAGNCDPATQDLAKVPYQADYLFLTK
jgi:hypothetical protein